MSKLDSMRPDVVQIAGLNTRAASNEGSPLCLQGKRVMKAGKVQAPERFSSIYRDYKFLHRLN